ncbi:hypothetical protein Pmani_013537 [Petrolisthes manimaculis]|uniref:Uncharacterized protein n=1 Tax=Petrolisthes manimaculis TaxID=1843537 RepID=A0AAE1UC29_9EUCA|nr:hypothetical protein Pmani_013537 [Petrolisthes manimaculis]
MIWVLAALSLLALPGVRGACGGKYIRDGNGPMDVIMSPGYSDGINYTDGLSCRYIFKSNNYQLSFVLNCPDGQFDVVETKECRRGDRMIIKDGLTIDDSYCGTNGPQRVMSGQPYLKVLFKSDNDGLTGPGYNCTVDTIVDPNYTTEAPTSRYVAAPKRLEKEAVARNFVPPQGYKCTCGETNMARVTGGEEPSSTSHPWLAAVLPVGETIPPCHGAIINDRHVLTAASCADIPNLQVRLAEHNLDTVGQTVTRDVTVLGTNGDLAILEMTSPINLSGMLQIRPICLPDGATDFTSLSGTVAGWGGTDAGTPFSLQLEEVSVTLADDVECSTLTIESDMLCAEEDNSTGLGMRDSGSPLVVEVNNKMVLAGVTASRESFGEPIVFNDIQDKLGWIQSMTVSATTCRS